MHQNSPSLDGQEDTELASQLLSEGKYPEAERICVSILQRSPGDVLALFILGTAFCSTGKYEQAIEPLCQAAALDPDNVVAFYNIGVACAELHRHAEAIGAYQAALAKDPDHVFSLNNLGVALLSTGRLDEAVACLRRVNELSPTHPMIATNLAKALSLRLPMNDWPEYYAMALADTSLSLENRYILLIHRAIAEWVIADDTALSLTLAELAELRPKSVSAQVETPMRYEVFLAKLLSYRNDNPSLYAEANETMFLVGDSHSLSYAGTRLTLDGADYKIASHVIIGAKAWHVASPKLNQYTVALDAYLANLPAGAQLVCVFGEIDCRITEGILPYWQKTGGELDDIVEGQVARYVSSLAVRAQQRSLKLYFLSVPAPHRKNGDRRTVITLFNAALKKYALEAGHRYVDLHTATRGDDGFSSENLHLEDTHLKPEALTTALANLECPSMRANALYAQGIDFCSAKRYEDAIQSFRQALALDPGNIYALYNTGVAYRELHRHTESIEAYRAALTKDPNHVFSLNNLGMALVYTGRLNEAIVCFRRVRELDPAHEMAAANLANTLALRMPMRDWSGHYAMALMDESLSLENRYILSVRCATAEWANGDEAALSSTLSAIARVRPETLNARTENTARYEVFLTALMKYKAANASLYTPANSSLFLIGDSHSLSYAGTRLTLDGADYKIASHVIIGAKAWHLASSKPNQYTAELDAYMSRLPATGAQLICAFGEIDCRIEEGILPYCKKTGGDLEKIVAKQVEQYVAALAGRVMLRRSMKLIFLSIPAPHRKIGDRRLVVTLFNAALEKYALEAGHRYIDLHAITRGDDGYAHEKLHIDDTHLKPVALMEALCSCQMIYPQL